MKTSWNFPRVPWHETPEEREEHRREQEKDRLGGPDDGKPQLRGS